VAWSGDLATTELQFSELSGCRIAWDRLLEGRNVVDSILHRRAVQQGRDLERVASTRDHLLFLVREKFREGMPEEFVKLIQEQESYEMLDTWYRAAVTSPTVEAFLAVLRQ
jgi:hypothetical protein